MDRRGIAGERPRRNSECVSDGLGPKGPADRYLKANDALEWGLVSSHCSDIEGQSKGKYEQRKSEGKGMDPDGNEIDQVSESKNSRSHDQKEYNDGIPAGDRR